LRRAVNSRHDVGDWHEAAHDDVRSNVGCWG
jgi:hypothetical protein